MRIFDTFCFFNELDLLELRLSELYPHVDKFVLVEAAKTQSLLDKPFYFEENKQRYERFMDKIIHVKISAEECPYNILNPWTMENFQRNCIARGFVDELLYTDDYVMISDLDEIPNMRRVKAVIEKGLSVFSVEMGFFAYYMNLRATQRNWIGTVVCRADEISGRPPQELRAIKDHLAAVRDGGWHFSWLGGYQKILEKSRSCIEPFDKSTLPTEEQFKSHFENFLSSDKKFFLHLENLAKQETEFAKVDIDSSFPAALVDNLSSYEHLVLK